MAEDPDKVLSALVVESFKKREAQQAAEKAALKEEPETESNDTE